MLAASGRVVWVGRGAAGARDGRVALFLREQVRDLLQADTDYEPPLPLHAAILEQLGQRGASFLMEIQDHCAQAVRGHTPDEFRAALWDLVWAGQISNDTFAPLRALGRPVRRRSVGEPLAGGRWSLVSQLISGSANATMTAVARAKLLLNRYGIVSREVAAAENLPGGFAAVYKVLREMEETGKLRRGYFIEGLSGAQFASAGAIEASAVLMSMDRKQGPPTAGFTTPDPELPEIDLVVGEPRAWEPGPSLSNSFGFGGHNGCVVLAPPS